jgi:hypothetical protein
MKYICLDCNSVFDEDERESVGHCDCGGYRCSGQCGCELVCPSCRSANYDEAYCCEFCGEYFAAEYMNDGVCIDCEKTLENESKAKVLPDIHNYGADKISDLFY